MDYKRFKQIFDERIFYGSKSELIKRLAESPNRYTGVYRSTRPETKLFQNVLQSQEIKFGGAFEVVIEEYLNDRGYTVLDKDEKKIWHNNERLEIDQLFQKDQTIFIVEQKVRDDHDTSNRAGQLNSLKKKVKGFSERYKDKKLECFLHFIDSSFSRHKKFYEEQMKTFTDIDPRVSVHLCYGGEFFEKLGFGEDWDEIVNHLKRWQKGLPGLPDIDFDKKPQESFEEIKELSPSIYRKLFSNEAMTDLLRIIFPQAATLELLEKWFEDQAATSSQKKRYAGLSEICREMIDNMIPPKE